jgi:hypothetical protein
LVCGRERQAEGRRVIPAAFACAQNPYIPARSLDRNSETNCVAKRSDAFPAWTIIKREKDWRTMTRILKSAFRPILLLSLMIAADALAQAETAAPPNAVVYFINLKDGDTVKSPFKIQFGLSGMGVAPAGVEKPNTGHHHLLIDTTLTPEQAKEPIPADDHHLHFGGGQTETTLTLPPGRHTLQLVLGDWSHVPFNPPIVSPAITVDVK